MYVNIYRLNIYIFSLKEFVAKTANCVPNVPVLILLTGRTLILCCFVDTIKADCLYQPSLKLGMSVTQNHGQWNERNSGQHLPGNQRKQQVYTLCSFCFVPSSTLYTSQGAPADIPAPWGRAPPGDGGIMSRGHPGTRSSCVELAFRPCTFLLLVGDREAHIPLVWPLLFWIFWYLQKNLILTDKSFSNCLFSRAVLTICPSWVTRRLCTSSEPSSWGLLVHSSGAFPAQLWASCPHPIS